MPGTMAATSGSRPVLHVLQVPQILRVLRAEKDLKDPKDLGNLKEHLGGSAAISRWISR